MAQACALMVLLGATLPAAADGGNGGGTGGGLGGTGYNGAAGGNGTGIGGGGGGGGAAGGGAGGGSADGATPGAGGTVGSPDGQDGGSGNFGSAAGGGGGGYHGLPVYGGGTVTVTGNVVGGSGGNGGDTNNGGSSGGGGAGGYGMVYSGTGSIVNHSTVGGGAGGRGGNTGNGGDAGDGGDGGIGLLALPGSTLLNNTVDGTISGGNGGAGGGTNNGGGRGAGGDGGAGVVGSNMTISNTGIIAGGAAGTVGAGNNDGSSAGAGGAGITGANLSIANAGTIVGGFNGDGTRANAVTFTGGVNYMFITASSTVLGNVQAFSGADTLDLTGPGDATLNLGQYRGFGNIAMNGTGAWTLAGTSTDTIAWTLNGGVLALSADAALGAANGAAQFDGGTLQWNDSFDLAATRTLVLNGGGGTLDTNGHDTTVASGISGTGRLTKTGAGTLKLTGANSYTGGTAINGGVVNISADGNLGAANSGVTLDAGTLQSGAAFTLGAARALSLGAGGGTIDTNGFDTTVASAISGAGSLTKTGAGTLRLTGANSFAGGTAIRGGVLNVSADNNLGVANGGVMLDGGTLQWGAAFNLNAARTLTLSALGGTFDTGVHSSTIAQTISGGGALTKRGTGTLTLAAVNSYGGGTTVAEGVLEVVTTGALGGGPVAFASGAGTRELRFSANASADALAIRTIASARTVFTDDSSAGSAQLVNDGGTTRFAAQAGAANATITNLDGGRLEFADTARAEHATVINQAGGVVDISGMAGSGIDIGALSGAGAIALGAKTLTLGSLNQNGTIDGAIGDGGLGGGLVKAGTGTLVLNAANTYTGPTVVQSGLLQLGDAAHPGASVAGNVAVQSGATLRGHGTVGGDLLNAGVVRPGGSIGTLTVAGNYTQAPGATLMVDISPTASSELKVAGAAALGGTLALLYGPGTYTAANYRVLSASAVTGSFSQVTGNDPSGLAQDVRIDANGVSLRVGAQVIDPEDPTPAAPPEGPVVVRPTHATIFGMLGSAAVREGQRINDVLLDRLGRPCVATGDRADCAGGTGAWIQASGNRTKVGGNADAPGYEDRRYGFLAGMDRQAGAWTLGAAAGYSHADLSENGTGSRGDIDTLRVAGYGSRDFGAVQMAGTLGYAHDFYSTKRAFGMLGNADGDGQGQQIHAGLQASTPMALGALTLTPRVGVRYQYFHGRGFSEEGPTSQNLAVGTQNLRSLQPFVGMALAYAFEAAGTRAGVVDARVGYAYETLDTDRTVTVASLDGTGFAIPGATASRGLLSAGLGLMLPMGKAVEASARYDALLDTGNVSAHAFRVGVKYRY